MVTWGSSALDGGLSPAGFFTQLSPDLRSSARLPMSATGRVPDLACALGDDPDEVRLDEGPCAVAPGVPATCRSSTPSVPDCAPTIAVPAPHSSIFPEQQAARLSGPALGDEHLRYARANPLAPRSRRSVWARGDGLSFDKI